MENQTEKRKEYTHFMELYNHGEQSTTTVHRIENLPDVLLSTKKHAPILYTVCIFLIKFKKP